MSTFTSAMRGPKLQAPGSSFDSGGRRGISEIMFHHTVPGSVLGPEDDGPPEYRACEPVLWVPWPTEMLVNRTGPASALCRSKFESTPVPLANTVHLLELQVQAGAVQGRWEGVHGAHPECPQPSPAAF